MGKIIGIDYGTKRTGIAVTDSLKIIASGLTTIPSEEILDFLESYMLKNDVECIVVGDAKDLKNQPTDSTAYIAKFVKKISLKFTDIKIEKIDERFTSKMAVRTMIDSGINKKKRRDKALIDEISATIILQSYLSQLSFIQNKRH